MNLIARKTMSDEKKILTLGQLEAMTEYYDTEIQYRTDIIAQLVHRFAKLLGRPHTKACLCAKCGFISELEALAGVDIPDNDKVTLKIVNFIKTNSKEE